MGEPLVDLQFYSREQLAAAAECSLSTVVRAIRDGEVAYDATSLGRRCFSKETAKKFAQRLAGKREL
ncbi:MAG: hypothetical protein JKY65_16825 [Planctomycetes bacterium]|nr:hypothetical protein [Planctomycetota bacterium]